MATHTTAGYSPVEIVRLTKTFAFAKTLATNVKLKEHRGLWTHPWLVTSVEAAPAWKDSNDLKRLIDAEVRWARERLDKAAHQSDGGQAFGAALESMRKATRSFFASYATLEAELANLNTEASNILGFSARSAAVAQASANIALAWIGLLSGPATIAVNMTAKRFILYSGEVSFKFIGQKLGAGLIASFGTQMATNMNEAVNSNFAIVQAVNNAPGFVDDSWQLFFAALNQSCVAKMEKQMGSHVAEVGKQTGKLYEPGMKALGDTRTEAAAAHRTAAVRSVQQQEQAIANYSPQGGGAGMQLAKASMKFAAWGLTCQATFDSLTTLYKQWNYE